MTIANQLNDAGHLSHATVDPFSTNGNSLGQLLGTLRVAPTAGMSKVAVPKLQIYYAVFAGVVMLVTLTVAMKFLNLNQFGAEALIVGTIIAISLTASAILKLQYRAARTVDVFENGLGFDDEQDGIQNQKIVLWKDVDLHENRVMVQPASHLSNNKLRRAIFTVRLNNFSVAQKSHEMILLVQPQQMELVSFIALSMECRNEEWAGAVCG